MSNQKNNPENSSGGRRETPSKEKPTPGRWQVGDRIANQYEIHRILGGPGKSGMGTVYICYDHEFKKVVAIKTLQDRFLQDGASRDRFKWEAEAWVKLEKHYNIVRAEYVDVMQGSPYIFMEYVVGDELYGTDLFGWIWRKGLEIDAKTDIPLILNFSIQFCHGMMHAQKKFEEIGKPFVHRDIKPSNILITRDRVVKITDFGLVKAFVEADEDIPSTAVGDEGYKRLSLSKSGNVCGTPPYMSPEQCRGEKDIDVRSDVYAFGCVLYEMLTGRYVFEGRTAEEFIRHHLKSTPESPAAHKELDRIVLKCLEKDADRRYHDFSELEKVLSALYQRLTGKVVKQPEGAELEAMELCAKGFSLSNLGIHEEAVACLRRAIKLGPNNPITHGTLGMIYDRQGNHEAAVGEYQESLRIDPSNAMTHFHLGIALGHQKNLDAAREEYAEALRIDPRYAMARAALGDIHYEQLEFDGAEEEYKEALTIDPNDAEVHCHLGGLYQFQGMLAEAQEEYEKALKINPNYAFARYKWGTVYLSAYRGILKRGNPVYLDAAVEQFKEALRLNPDDVRARYDLVDAYKAQGRFDLAAAECKEILKLTNGAGGHSSLGRVYKAQGKYDEAIKEFKENLRIHPNSPYDHFSLASVYEAAGNVEEAIASYQTFLDLASPAYLGCGDEAGEPMGKKAEESIRRLKQKT